MNHFEGSGCQARVGYRRRLLAGWLTAMVLVGCAPTLPRPGVPPDQLAREEGIQKRTTFLGLTTHFERLLDVAYPILVAGAELCPSRQPFYGMILHDRQLYQRSLDPGFARIITALPNLAATAIAQYSLGDGVYVRYVHKDLPARRAGLRPGDEILSIDDVSSRVGAAALMGYLGRGDAQKPHTLRVLARRDGASFEASVSATTACFYSIGLQASSVANAYANGRRMIFTTGLLSMASSDDELAYVIGHELAHNALGHTSKRAGNFLIGFLGDAIAGFYGVSTYNILSLVGNWIFSQEFEAEADYVGIYAAARGGFDISKAVDIERRMGEANPQALEHLFWFTHPTSPQRTVAIKATIAEVESKRKRGLPLVPGNAGV